MGFSSSTRLRREDCKRTKHDPVFSQWEILIGPFDWQNYSLGKHGIEKYRIHNIPSTCSCPGLYELGVAAVSTDLGRDVRKLGSDRVVVVYLGQADNIRARLQHYGRAGSHLDYGKSFFDLSGDYSSKGPGLFREIFSRGFPIVFRWASMENKKIAEKTEAQLLSVFDYAWNKGGNGERRPSDIYQKLDKIVSRNTTSPNISRKIHKWFESYRLPGNRKGIKIKAMPLSVKEVKVRPALITVKQELNGDDLIVCGLSLSDGSVCKRSPVKGRKRCEEHKGKRNIGSLSRSVKQEKFLECAIPIKSEPVEVSMQEGKNVNLSQNLEGNLLHTELNTVCGVVLNDQTICKDNPIKGRKRCGKHKGIRIAKSLSKPASEGNSTVSVCGVGLGDGEVCLEVPVYGRKRCAIHKGKRVTA